MPETTKITSENAKKGARIRATRGIETGILFDDGIHSIAGGGSRKTPAILVLRDGEKYPTWTNPEEWEIDR